MAVEHIVFHHGGREYTIFDSLTPDEIEATLKMADERDRKLNPLNPKSTRKYFEDTDRMVSTILRKCFHMTDEQIKDMGEIESRRLTSDFIKFLASANNLSNIN